MPSVRIDGYKELDRKLRQLEPKVSKKILRTGLRKAAKPVAAEARKLAPVKTGALKKAIKVRAMKRSRVRLGMRVSVGAGDFKGKTFYAALLEYGIKKGKRGRTKDWVDNREQRIQPLRYMRRAADAKLGESLRILTDELTRAIREATKGK